MHAYHGNPRISFGENKKHLKEENPIKYEKTWLWLILLTFRYSTSCSYCNIHKFITSSLSPFPPFVHIVIVIIRINMILVIMSREGKRKHSFFAAPFPTRTTWMHCNVTGTRTRMTKQYRMEYIIHNNMYVYILSSLSSPPAPFWTGVN